MLRVPHVAIRRNLERFLRPVACCDDWLLRSNPLTLRFVEPGVERGYVKLCSDELVPKLSLLGAMLLLLCVVLWFEWTDDRCCSTALSVALIWRRRAVIATVAALGAVVMVATRVKRFMACVQPALCELGTVCTIVAVTITVYYTNPYYMVKLEGQDPAAIFATDLSEEHRRGALTDTRLLLTIDFIVTVSHLALPIRWCVLWPVELAGVLFYAMMIGALGSPEGQGSAGVNLLFLMGLTFGALMGKRRIEFHERVSFFHAQYPNSGTPGSFEAERPLSVPSNRIETGAVGSRGDDESSVSGSVPTTTHTGQLFEGLESHDRSEILPRLEQIAEIGQREHWLVKADNVRLMPGHILGSGSFGVVVLASLHGTFVAVKVNKNTLNGTTAWHLPSLGNELRILRHIRHPNLVLFHGACVDPTSGELALVLEYVHGQQLDEYLKAGDVSSRDRHCIAVDTCRALRYLHGQHPCVVHGDLKASNVLVEGSRKWPHAKLVDFGLSRMLTRRARPLGGTLNWMAPELLQHPGMTPAPSADVFSFGRLAYFVTTGIRPHADMERRTLVKMARRAQLPPLDWPDDAPFIEECRYLVERCLQFDPFARPDMVQVHCEVAQWLPPSDSAELGWVPAASSEDSELQDQSVSWRSGLRLVRATLRPLPPQRGAAASGSLSTRPPPSESRRASLELMAGGSSASASSSKAAPPTLRWERPLPPPRLSPPPTNIRGVMPTLPSVPEVDNACGPKNSEALTQAEGLPSTQADGSSSHGSGRHRLSFSQRQLHRETPTPMMEISVIDAMQRWNFHSPESSCCHWHVALEHLKLVHKAMCDRGCHREFQPVREWQCPRCLLMDVLDKHVSVAEKDCDMCGYTPRDGSTDSVTRQEQASTETDDGEDSVKL